MSCYQIFALLSNTKKFHECFMYFRVAKLGIHREINCKYKRLHELKPNCSNVIIFMPKLMCLNQTYIVAYENYNLKESTIERIDGS